MAAHVLAGTNHPTGPHKFSVVVDACAAPGNKASPALSLCFRSVLFCRQYNTKKKNLNLFLSSGNKASHLAAIAMEPRGMLVAVEADAVREKLLRATLRRQLCFNVRVVGKDMLMDICIYGYTDIWMYG